MFSSRFSDVNETEILWCENTKGQTKITNLHTQLKLRNIYVIK